MEFNLAEASFGEKAGSRIPSPYCKNEEGFAYLFAAVFENQQCSSAVGGTMEALFVPSPPLAFILFTEDEFEMRCGGERMEGTCLEAVGPTPPPAKVSRLADMLDKMIAGYYYEQLPSPQGMMGRCQGRQAWHFLEANFCCAHLLLLQTRSFRFCRCRLLRPDKGVQLSFFLFDKWT